MTILIGRERVTFPGTTENGVTSASRTRWPGSFAVVDGGPVSPADADAGLVPLTPTPPVTSRTAPGTATAPSGPAIQIAPGGGAPSDADRDVGSLFGKYRGLITVLRGRVVAADRQEAGEVDDLGYQKGGRWKSHVGVPPGFWVSVYPDLYVWREEVR